MCSSISVRKLPTANDKRWHRLKVACVHSRFGKADFFMDSYDRACKLKEEGWTFLAFTRFTLRDLPPKVSHQIFIPSMKVIISLLVFGNHFLVK